MREIQYGTVSGQIVAIGVLTGRLNAHTGMTATIFLPVKTGGTDTSDATAEAQDLRQGKTAYARNRKLTGSMPDRGAFVGVIRSRDEQAAIPQGYHNGNGHVGISQEQRSQLISENIRYGKVLLGIPGSYKGDYMETMTDSFSDIAEEVTP